MIEPGGVLVAAIGDTKHFQVRYFAESESLYKLKYKKN